MNVYKDVNSEDLQWMQAYRLGDVEAFDRLYKKYSGKVMGFLNTKLNAREDRDEVFQATWIKFHQARASFNPKFPVLNWIYVITRSCLNDFFRKRERARAKDGGELSSELVDDLSFQDWLHRSDLDQKGQSPNETEASLTFLEDITPEQRKAVELRVIHEMEYEEIARTLNTTPINSRKLVSRGLNAIKKKLGGVHEIA